MKKWIFPFVFLIFEFTCILLYLTPSIFASLPHWIQATLQAFDAVLNWFTGWMALPTISMGQGENAILSNLFVLFLLNVILFSFYFLIVYLHSRQKKKAKEKKEEPVVPKNEFDPMLFEKKTPTLRLAFLWVPVNLWIVYYLFLNSIDLQENLKNSASWLYFLFQDNFAFYQNNALPLMETDITFRILIFLAGVLTSLFIYWMIFSFFAILFRKPMASFRARRALKAHEKRVARCQSEEVVVENLEILEHAKFRHSRAIVETIADIDHSKSIEKKHDGSDYFEHLSHGIADLGVAKPVKPDVPVTIRKPIRVIYPTEEESIVKNKVVVSEEIETSSIQLNPELDALVLPSNVKEETKEEEVKEEVIPVEEVIEEKEEESSTETGPILPVSPYRGKRPVKPKKLRPAVHVTPVTPRMKEEQREMNKV